MDRRWQLVLDCLDAEAAPFSKGDAGRLPRAADRPRAGPAAGRADGGAGGGNGAGSAPGPLRAALDSSPLWGAGRVEDTNNLLGHALRKAWA